MNRGGSWNNGPVNARSANRNRNSPANRNNNLGFRVASSSAGRGGYRTDGTDRTPVPSRLNRLARDGQMVLHGRLVLVAGLDERRERSSRLIFDTKDSRSLPVELLLLGENLGPSPNAVLKRIGATKPLYSSPRSVVKLKVVRASLVTGF